MVSVFPVFKKMRTDGGIGLPTQFGELTDPNLNRKNPNKKKSLVEAIEDMQPFKIGNYRGALQEWLQKRGNVTLSFEVQQKQPNDLKSGGIFISTCKAGDVIATGEAKGKKLARQQSALAVIKKMKLISGEEKFTKTVAKEVPQSKKKEKNAVEELSEEIEFDDENIYTGTVNYYRPDQEFGFISLSKRITFKGATAKKSIWVSKLDIVCDSDEVGMYTDSKVLFRVYRNSAGLGAYEVTNEDGSPIQYDLEKEEQIQLAKRAIEVKPIIENDQYLNGNLRGALQEWLAKKYRGVTVHYESELQELSTGLPVQHVHVARCKLLGGESERFKKLVGIGRASLKKKAFQLSALDYMLKLNILTIDQHSRFHDPKEDGAIGSLPAKK